MTYTYPQVIHIHYLLIKYEQNSFKINFKWKMRKGKTLVLSAWYSSELFLYSPLWILVLWNMMW